MKRVNYVVIASVLFSSTILTSCGTTKVVYRPIPQPPIRVVRPLPRAVVVYPAPVVVYPKRIIVVDKTH
ncbi:MAG: hypothetical protein AAF634_02865 [Bacteroidota bacterium]